MGTLLSLNPFHADPAIRSRFESLDAAIGTDVRRAIAHGLERTRRDVARNHGGVLLHEDVDEIRQAYGLTVEELLLLARPAADTYARPPISDFHVGVAGLEAVRDGPAHICANRRVERLEPGADRRVGMEGIKAQQRVQSI